MSRLILCSFIIALLGLLGASAQREWTLLSGSNQPLTNPVYAGLGIPSTNANPGARSWGNGAYDPVNREVWIFGGWLSNDTRGQQDQVSNDLWRFRMNDSTWTWMSGADTANSPGFYSPVGVSDPLNTPAARTDACMWIDVQHRELWLHGGGSPAGTLADIWVYSLINFTWTLRGGSNATNDRGVYDMKGVASTNYRPRSRQDHICWFDPQTSLAYIFGGYDACNDMWRFDRADNTWTWVYGSNCSALPNRDVPTVYGPVGVPMSDIGPGTVAGAVGLFWKEERTAFLYGGDGLANSTRAQNLANFWGFNVDTLQWTFLSGSNDSNAAKAVFGEKGVPSSSNSPGSRYDGGGWIDGRARNLFLWGGLKQFRSNDMWSLGAESGTWVWIAGDNVTSPTTRVPGNYEQVGVPSLTAYPSGRQGHVVVYDPDGNDAFVYAGWAWCNSSAVEYVNELWHFKYRDDPPPPPALPPQAPPTVPSPVAAAPSTLPAPAAAPTAVPTAIASPTSSVAPLSPPIAAPVKSNASAPASRSSVPVSEASPPATFSVFCTIILILSVWLVAVSN